MSNSKINIDYADIVSKAIMPHGWKSLIPLYDTCKLLVEPVIDKIIQSVALVDGDDSKKIAEIIRSGKENGVDEMDIRIEKNAGVDIGGNLENLGIPCGITIRVGAQGETLINVKYK